jgi:branched-chain amino acid transport system substrate-binding protein
MINKLNKSPYLPLQILTLLIFTLLVQHIVVADTIKLGAIFSKTGIASASNVDHWLGVRFAVKEINSHGGILGKPIELIEYDNRSKQIGAKIAATKASKDGVVAVIGNSWSSHSLASAPVLQKAGIVMISPDSTNVDVTKVGDYIFRSCFIDSFQGMVMAKFAIEELKHTTAAIMIDVKSDYSRGLASYFKNNFISLGGKVVVVENYTHNQRDFSKQLEKVKPYKPDIIFIPGHGESIFIARQAQNIGINTTFIFGDGLDYSSAFTKGVGKIKHAFASASWDEKIGNDNSQHFVSALKKEGKRSSSVAALAYDSVYLVKNAIEQAKSSKSEAIRESLSKTKGFQGVTGSFSFNKSGDPIKSAVIIEIKEGKQFFYKLLKPN